MRLLRPLAAAFLCVCPLAASSAAQSRAAQSQPERGAVVASASADRVRFAAPNRVAWLRLEVVSPSGEVLFLANSKGSVLDWTLSDSQGDRLADGQYLCVVTAKDVAGKPTQRITLVEIAGGVASARAAAASDLTPMQAEVVGPVEAESAAVVTGGEAPAATLVAHDGTDGQLVTTAGDLSFRGGDFFTGRDRELMRLSADGSLEVSGTLLARGGIRFSDGTILQSAGVVGRGGKGAKAGRAGASAAPGDDVTASATLDRLAKFDAGGNLIDSSVVETGGRVGINRTTGLSYRLEVQATTTASGIRSVGTAALGAGSGGGLSLETNALPTAANQRLGAFFWGASDGVSTFNPAIVAGYSAEAWTATNRGTYFEFETTAEGSSARSKVLRIAATGQGGLFTAPSADVRGLAVRGATGQTANLQEWQDAAGAPLAVLGSSGRLGIGTISPLDRLHVLGNVRVAGAGNGLIFPDGTKQTTAATGGGGGLTLPFSSTTSSANTLFALTQTGMGGGADFRIDNPSNGTHPVFIQNMGVNTALQVHQSGTQGSAGHFGIQSPSNASTALTVANTGTGDGMSIGTTGMSSTTLTLTGGHRGLVIGNGRLVLNFQNRSSGETMPSNVLVVSVLDNGVASSPAAITLPDANNIESGTIIFVTTTDPDGVNVSGTNLAATFVPANRVRFFVRVEPVAWKPAQI